jgi:hypothetical protein
MQFQANANENSARGASDKVMTALDVAIGEGQLHARGMRPAPWPCGDLHYENGPGKCSHPKSVMCGFHLEARHA